MVPHKQTTEHTKFCIREEQVLIHLKFKFITHFIENGKTVRHYSQTTDTQYKYIYIIIIHLTNTIQIYNNYYIIYNYIHSSLT